MACRAPRLFRHRQTFQYWVASCQRWACGGCTREVARRWSRILNWASRNGPAPQFFLTLTCKEPLPLWRQAPAGEQEALRQQAGDLAQRLTRALGRLVAEIREQFGPCEYLAVVELTTGRRSPGHRPHLHLLVRGPALSRQWLSDRWRFHTKGSFIVDIQRLRTPQLAGQYLMGYTTTRRKQAQRQHLSEWPGPRIRYSQGYFPLPVAQIRAQLWPPSEPGQWEYMGPWLDSLQLAWESVGTDGDGWMLTQQPTAGAGRTDRETKQRRQIGP